MLTLSSPGEELPGGNSVFVTEYWLEKCLEVTH